MLQHRPSELLRKLARDAWRMVDAASNASYSKRVLPPAAFAGLSSFFRAASPSVRLHQRLQAPPPLLRAHAPNRGQPSRKVLSPHRIISSIRASLNQTIRAKLSSERRLSATSIKKTRPPSCGAFRTTRGRGGAPGGSASFLDLINGRGKAGKRRCSRNAIGLC